MGSACAKCSASVAEAKEVVMILESELMPYQNAARHVCERLHEHPEHPVRHESGAIMPQWAIYAAQMHTMRLMQDGLQIYGPWGQV